MLLVELLQGLLVVGDPDRGGRGAAGEQLIMRKVMNVTTRRTMISWSTRCRTYATLETLQSTVELSWASVHPELHGVHPPGEAEAVDGRLAVVRQLDRRGDAVHVVGERMAQMVQSFQMLNTWSAKIRLTSSAVA